MRVPSSLQRRQAACRLECVALDVDEQQRLVRDLDRHKAMILRNHGLLTAGKTIAEAFDLIYYLERACTAQIDALAGGSKLRIPDAADAAKVAAQFRNLPYKKKQTEWLALRRTLERVDPSDRDREALHRRLHAFQQRLRLYGRIIDIHLRESRYLGGQWV